VSFRRFYEGVRVNLRFYFRMRVAVPVVGSGSDDEQVSKTQ